MTDGIKKIAHTPVAHTVYFCDTGQAVLIVCRVSILCFKVPNSLYVVSAFEVHIVEQLVAGFFKTEVAGDGDIRCIVASATEDNGIVTICFIVPCV